MKSLYAKFFCLIILGALFAKPVTAINHCGDLIQEAENGTLSGRFTTGFDSAASGGQYVHVPKGSGKGKKVAGNAHKATYCFDVTTSGTYRLKGWVYAANGGSNSFFVQINDLPVNGYFWEIPRNKDYLPNYVSDRGHTGPIEVSLAAGEHTVTVYFREAGTRLDKLALEMKDPAVTSTSLPAPTPTPIPTETPAPAEIPLPTETPLPTDTSNPGILWSADHETGDFSQWEYNQGRAIFNSNTPPGTSDASITDEVAHSGNYALKLSLTGASDGQSQGTRVVRRWLDSSEDPPIPLPDEAYYSAWYYFPQVYKPQVWWNVFQFKSKSPDGVTNAMFSFNIGYRNDIMYLYVYDKILFTAHGQGDGRLPIPVGQWVHIEAYLKKRFDNTGQLTVWQDGVKIIDVLNIRTIFGEDDRLRWSVNNYTDDITPSDPVIYVDDAVISTERVGTD